MNLEFDWDEEKNRKNFEKHGVWFEEARQAFTDQHRVIVFDPKHSGSENRWFCYGKVGKKVMSVRFTLRDNVIRIIGAGYWRQWRRYYDEKRGH